jgi:Flp pilus assembly protein TadD
LLATCPDTRQRDPREAVRQAEKAVELAPNRGDYWNTLGVAHYRAGDWKAAEVAIENARALRDGGDVVDWLFLAMTQWQLGRHDEARRRYERAARWLQKNSKAPIVTPQVLAFRAEAEEVLGLKKK